MRRNIAVLPCDGAGKEVVPEAIKVLKAAGADYEFQEYDVNADQYMRTGEPIPAQTWSDLQKADSILFGAVGDPRVNDAAYLAGVLLRLRFELDLYVNLRPARLYDDRLSPLRREDRRKIDLLIVRENTEGLYVGMGGRFKRGTEEEVAIQEDVNTHLGVTRIIDYAFSVARREVVMVDKSNAMTYAGGLWQDRWKAVAKKYLDIKTRHLYVDAAAMQLVRDPSQFEVIVTGNLFGDILSDLTAGLIGGMGMAPSADIGDNHAVFQPCHGTAPDIMGQGKANPTGMILSAAMMLDWLADRHGLESAAEAGERIERAVDKVYAQGIRPIEFGGGNGTADIAKAVLAAL